MLPTLLGDGLAVERDRGLFLAELLAGSAPVVAPSAAAETSGDVSQRATARQNANASRPVGADVCLAVSDSARA